ncbi:MAG: hypothetical protein LBD86_03035 [Spirochaetaceae bacterium]|nr:hypothetical protein [Spirochaetaceae bacterium]
MKRLFLFLCAATALASCKNEYEDIGLPVYRAEPDGMPIASAEEFALIGSKYPLDGTYYLAADIDFSGFAEWTPIGPDAARPFTGILYGNGRTVRGLKLGGGAMYTGLFGYLQFARISNVTVELDNDFNEALTLTSTAQQYLGVVAGYAIYSDIKDITLVTAEDKGLNITKTTGTLCAGGLVGQTSASTVSGGEVSLNLKITVTGNTLYAGLVSGYSLTGTIDSCSVDGSMEISATSGTTATSTHIGGITGNSTSGIKNCLSAVRKINVTGGGGKEVSVGGIVGWGGAVSSGIKTEDSVTIYVKDASPIIYVGGISGCSRTATIDRCFVDAPVSIKAESNANLYVGGILGTGTNISKSFIRRGEVQARMTGTNTSGNKVVLAGGIIGDLYHTNSSGAGKISNCFSGANVRVESAWVPLLGGANAVSAVTAAGGVAGFAGQYHTIENSGASGDVEVVSTNAGANGRAFAGGIVGLCMYSPGPTGSAAFTLNQSVALNGTVSVEHAAATSAYTNRVVGAASTAPNGFTLAASAAVSDMIALLGNYALPGMKVKTSTDSGLNWTNLAQTNNTAGFTGSGNMKRTREFFETSSLVWDFSTNWEWDTELDLPLPRIK